MINIILLFNFSLLIPRKLQGFGNVMLLLDDVYWVFTKNPILLFYYFFLILCHTLSSTILCSIYLTICTVVYLTNAQQIAVVNTVDDEGRTLEVNNKLTCLLYSCAVVCTVIQ